MDSMVRNTEETVHTLIDCISTMSEVQSIGWVAVLKVLVNHMHYGVI